MNANKTVSYSNSVLKKQTKSLDERNFVKYQEDVNQTPLFRRFKIRPACKMGSSPCSTSPCSWAAFRRSELLVVRLRQSRRTSKKAEGWRNKIASCNQTFLSRQKVCSLTCQTQKTDCCTPSNLLLKSLTKFE
jgi:hypothetical protein